MLLRSANPPALPIKAQAQLPSVLVRDKRIKVQMLLQLVTLPVDFAKAQTLLQLV